jgi:hypothetical protein
MTRLRLQRSVVILVTIALCGAATLALASERGVTRRTAAQRYGLPEHVVAFAALEPAAEDGAGWGRVQVRDDDLPSGLNRTLQVWLYGLLPGATYEVVIDGVPIGTLTMHPSGSDVLKLQTHGGGHEPVPEELPPAGELLLVEVLDETEAVVLVGDFSILRESSSSTTVCQETITLEDVASTGATGIARVEEKSSGEQEFMTHATGLVPEEEYEIFVDDILVGVVIADEEGQARLSLESPDADNPLPEELLPVCGSEGIETVKWKLGGDVILQGSFTGVSDAEEPEEIEFLATVVEEPGADSVLVDTGTELITVMVTPDTIFKKFSDLSELMVGDVVEVSGWWEDTDFIARKITLEERADEPEKVEFVGTVAEEPGVDSLVVDTDGELMTVLVTGETDFKNFGDLSELSVGDRVQVLGWMDGADLVADKIWLR